MRGLPLVCRWARRLSRSGTNLSYLHFLGQFMKRFAICSWALLGAGALLEAQLTVPQVGVARYADGSVHPVRGIAGNLIVEPRAIATAEGASFSDSAGLLSVGGEIQFVRTDGTVLGEYRSGETSPVLNIDPLAQAATAWLPSKHLLVWWNGSAFVEAPVDDSAFGGRVTFVSLASGTTAQFFIGRADSSVARISVSLPSGRIASSDTTPGARGQTLMQQGWILSQDDWGLTAERANGNRQTIQLSQRVLPADDLTMERMADHWLHVSSRSTGTGWAVYLDATKVNIFLLPAPKKLEAAR